MNLHITKILAGEPLGIFDRIWLTCQHVFVSIEVTDKIVVSIFSRLQILRAIACETGVSNGVILRYIDLEGL